MAYHEPVERLDEQSLNHSRALTTLKEEIEAIDWYTQRIGATTEGSLKKVLDHNRGEEMEHAAMALEWLRRNMDGWDERLRTYLFTEGDLLEIEEQSEEAEEQDGQ